MPEIAPAEYVLPVEKTKFGTLCLLMSDRGTKLKILRVGDRTDRQFYELVGPQEPTTYYELDSSAKFIHLDSDMQVWLDGGWKSITDAVQDLYYLHADFWAIPKEDADLYDKMLKRAELKGEVHLDELLEKTSEPEDMPRHSFLWRHPYLLMFPGIPIALAPLGFATTIIESFGIPAVPYYVGAGIFTAVGGTAIIVAGVKARRAYDRLEQVIAQRNARRLESAMASARTIERIDKQLDDLSYQYETLRQSLLRAGVVKGMFPPEYGLR